MLTVGGRCMELGYTCIWPKEQFPYFIWPAGVIIHLVGEQFFHYLALGSEYCKPRKLLFSQERLAKLHLKCDHNRN